MPKMNLLAIEMYKVKHESCFTYVTIQKVLPTKNLINRPRQNKRICIIGNAPSKS